MNILFQLTCALAWCVHIGQTQKMDDQALGAMAVLSLPYLAFAIFARNETPRGQKAIFTFSFLATAAACYLAKAEAVEADMLPFIQGMVLFAMVSAVYGALKTTQLFSSDD